VIVQAVCLAVAQAKLLAQPVLQFARALFARAALQFARALFARDYGLRGCLQ